MMPFRRAAWHPAAAPADLPALDDADAIGVGGGRRVAPRSVAVEGHEAIEAVASSSAWTMAAAACWSTRARQAFRA